MRWSRPSKTVVLARRGEFGHRHTRREDSHVNKGRDWSDMPAHPGIPKMAANCQRSRRDWKHPPLASSGTAPPCRLLNPTSSLQNYERTNFYCFKPPNLWCFVTVAHGNHYLSLQALPTEMFLQMVWKMSWSPISQACEVRICWDRAQEALVTIMVNEVRKSEE